MELLTAARKLPSFPIAASRYIAPRRLNQRTFLLLIGWDSMLASLFHPSSYFGIVLFLVLTGCGLPLPEEVAIILAGVLSAQGHLLAVPALIACLIGALLGDSIIYAIGHRWGHSLLSYHPRLAKLLGAEREKRFEDAIEQHALKVMMLSRFLVGVRAPVYLATGVVRLPFRRFLLYDLICASLVVGLFFGLSYLFGDHVARWVRDAELKVTLVVLAIVLVTGLLLYRRHKATIYHVIFESELPPK
jgi:membrane protein DedA with SNARE-associated domain